MCCCNKLPSVEKMRYQIWLTLACTFFSRVPGARDENTGFLNQVRIKQGIATGGRIKEVFPTLKYIKALLGLPSQFESSEGPN